MRNLKYLIFFLVTLISTYISALQETEMRDMIKLTPEQTRMRRVELNPTKGIMLEFSWDTQNRAGFKETDKGSWTRINGPFAFIRPLGNELKRRENMAIYINAHFKNEKNEDIVESFTCHIYPSRQPTKKQFGQLYKDGWEWYCEREEQIFNTQSQPSR